MGFVMLAPGWCFVCRLRLQRSGRRWLDIFGTVRGIVHDVATSSIADAAGLFAGEGSDWKKAACSDRKAVSVDAVPAGEYTVTS